MVNYFLILIIGIASALPTPQTLVHLGDIEGKSFYAEFNLSIVWSEAFAYCDQLGLKLARVETEAQAEFLMTKLPLYEQHWISIKDINVNSPNPTWTWDNEGAHSFDEGMLWTDSGDVQDDGTKCGVFLRYIDNHPAIFPERCDHTWPHAMCEGVANSTIQISSAAVPKSESKSIRKVKAISQNDFIHLGNIEGKSFYYREPVQLEKFDWLESYEICEENNMTLATVTSQAQADLLASSIGQRNWAEVYWTAAGNVDYTKLDIHYNSTGAYTWTDYKWVLDGRLLPGLWCGAFWCQWCSRAPNPVLNLRSCQGREPYFICQVEH